MNINIYQKRKFLTLIHTKMYGNLLTMRDIDSIVCLAMKNSQELIRKHWDFECNTSVVSFQAGQELCLFVKWKGDWWCPSGGLTYDHSSVVVGILLYHGVGDFRGRHCTYKITQSLECLSSVKHKLANKNKPNNKPQQMSKKCTLCSTISSSIAKWWVSQMVAKRTPFAWRSLGKWIYIQKRKVTKVLYWSLQVSHLLLQHY